MRVVLRCLGHRGDLATTVSPKRTFLAPQKSLEKCLGDSVVFSGMRSVLFIAAVLMPRTRTPPEKSASSISRRLIEEQ
jgi:hypothetical protein